MANLRQQLTLLSMAVSAALAPPVLAEQRPLELADILQFREIEQQVISDNGEVLAFAAVPDFGDAEGQIVRVGEQEVRQIARADQPQISADSAYVMFRQQPSLFDRERETTEEETAELTTDAVLVQVDNGEQETFTDVANYGFTPDGDWLLVLHEPDEDAKGGTLLMRELSTGEEREFQEVTDFFLPEEGRHLGLVMANDERQWVRLFNRETETYLNIVEDEEHTDHWTEFTFTSDGEQLVFLAGPADSDYREPAFTLKHWSFGDRYAAARDLTEEGWMLTSRTTLDWQQDDSRLVFGQRPANEARKFDPAKPESEEDLYDLERLLEDRRLQVWHGEDDRIVTHQRESYEQRLGMMAAAIWYPDSDEVVYLSDHPEFQVQVDQEQDTGALASDARPYLREITWAGFYHDLYHVDLKTGEYQQIAERLPSSERGSLSPDGQHVVYVQDETLHLFDATAGESRAVATAAEVSWVDELNDRPFPASAYGVAGWHEDSTAFYVYDRYDIWQVDVASGEASMLTANGRENRLEYRVAVPDDGVFEETEELLLRTYQDWDKTSGFASLTLGADEGPTELIHGEKTYRLVEFHEDSQQVFFTEEDFRQFPDIQVTAMDFAEPVRLTEVNPQRDEFIWGNAELVEWESQVGDTLQGVLIKPDDFDENKEYPVMVYYYAKFSQRVHQWNQMKVNHRPNFPYYVGQDYLVFLPDINFRTPEPGLSAVESLVPGIEKIVEMGIADPDAIGLHGHSWSGYQTAFVVTETDTFAAAVAGAPVSNMTSAYTGIRWGSGLARQFQYESGQSRLGVSMYEDREPYIKNSPVFYADQINTPLLIQFGDADEAVPWEQGIELYLALRRLDKDVVMLHYEDEPHHLQRLANKIDYTIKMREFFDYYLKDEEVPDWWQDGMPYQPYD